MNILYICPRLPYPPQGGDKTVICNQLKFLSRNNKITLLSLIEDDKELRTGLSGLSPYCAKVEVFRKRPNFSISNFLTVARKTDPFTVIRYYSPRMHKRAKELVESADFDIVHVAFYYMAQYAVSKDIRVPSKTALVIDTHLVEYLLYDAHGRLAKNPFLKLFSKLEAARIKRYEFPIYAKFDRCMTFSELDKANIVKMSGASNVVVNPAPTELPVPEKEIFAGRDEEKNTVLFFGGLKYVPNEDGVKFFYESV
ncbi:MAG: hypothetical protein NTV07_02690, partial [Candidatus Omnitrophica bacterium]|nr:hypothetical protein [Candidatus Omnitrophota bacterium]